MPIENRELTAGTRLVARYKKQEHTATVVEGEEGGLRYRLAFVPAGATTPRVLYDNHHPKGHHRHCARAENAYPFTTVARLLRDFLADVRRAKAARGAREEPE